MLFDSWAGLGRVLLVGTLAYAALVVLLRISGKRTLTKLNAFDLVVTVALGSTLATVLLSKSVALAEGVLALALLVFLQYAIAWLSVRSPRFQSIVKAEPRLLAARGRFLEGALRAQRITREEILPRCGRAARRDRRDRGGGAGNRRLDQHRFGRTPAARRARSPTSSGGRPAGLTRADRSERHAGGSQHDHGGRHAPRRGAGRPDPGSGLWHVPARRRAARGAWSRYALEIGYRHIDTAQMYGNEAEVGAAVAGSGVPRDEIWLTTKIWPDDFRAADLQRAAEASVERLRTVPDLLLLHWPNPRVPLAETLGALRGEAVRA